MAKIDIDMVGIEKITVDSIGKPGERVFYFQASNESDTVTLLIEKIQIQMLILGIEQFMADLKQKFPDLDLPDDHYEDSEMKMQMPIDPLFRVGELSLGYDVEQDLMVLIAHQDENGAEPGEDLGAVRFWCLRSLIARMKKWAIELVSRGRPTWPSSGEPILPEGQFSPKNNGHKH